MNHLAHALLADDGDPESLIGNIAGDYIKGPLAQHALAPGVARGVRHHRRVDAFTDAHPVTTGLRAAFPAGRRRFAGIALDVSFDHFLARHWHRFSALPRETFIVGVYAQLERHRAQLPAPFDQLAPRLIAADWLSRCEDLDGVEGALAAIGRRSRHRDRLLRTREDIEANYRRIEAGFLELFPEVLALR